MHESAIHSNHSPTQELELDNHNQVIVNLDLIEQPYQIIGKTPNFIRSQQDSATESKPSLSPVKENNII